MAKTPILEIPYPDEGDEEFYGSFQSMMRELKRLTLMNKIQTSSLLGGGGTIAFTVGTGLLTWTADFVLPILHYGKKITIPYRPNGATRTAALRYGSALVIEVPYTMNADQVTNFNVLNQLDRLNHQLFVLAVRIGSKVHFRGMSPIG